MRMASSRNSYPILPRFLRSIGPPWTRRLRTRLHSALSVRALPATTFAVRPVGHLAVMAPHRVDYGMARYNSIMSLWRWQHCILLVACALAPPAPAAAADQPQWGRAWSRNMASDETRLPDTFNLATGCNVKWVAELGSHRYATPSIAEGRVLIGTNNDRPRGPSHQGDRAVLTCLAAS